MIEVDQLTKDVLCYLYRMLQMGGFIVKSWRIMEFQVNINIWQAYVKDNL